jgi:hypothetical protein
VTRATTDPSNQFQNGNTTTPFTIPAGASTATVSLQAGTVAGQLTLTASGMQFSGSGGTDVTPSQHTVSGPILPAIPVIKTLTATRSGNGITVVVVGYSTTRELDSASFTFAVTGRSQQTVSETLTNIANILWYDTPGSVQYGSQFTYTQQFAVTGDSTQITQVSVTLTNNQPGLSNPVTAQIQ